MTDRRSWTRRFHQVLAVCFTAAGIYAVKESLQWPILGHLGPGPGLLPLCLGIGLAAVCLVWLLRVSIGAPADESDLLPDAGGALRIATVIGATVAYGLLLDEVGFIPTMFGLVLVIMLVLRATLLTSAVAALLTSTAIYYLFALLEVPLPAIGIG